MKITSSQKAALGADARARFPRTRASSRVRHVVRELFEVRAPEARPASVHGRLDDRTVDRARGRLVRVRAQRGSPNFYKSVIIAVMI